MLLVFCCPNKQFIQTLISWLHSSKVVATFACIGLKYGLARGHVVWREARPHCPKRTAILQPVQLHHHLVARVYHTFFTKRPGITAGPGNLHRTISGISA